MIKRSGSGAMAFKTKRKAVFYIVDSIGALRNTTPFQRAWFLSNHFDLYVLSLYANCPEGLKGRLHFTRNPLFRLRWLGAHLFPLWCLWRSYRLRHADCPMVITSPHSFPIVAGFLVKAFFNMAWVADVYDVPNLELEAFQHRKGLKNAMKFRILLILDLIVHKLLKKCDLVLCTLVPEALAEYHIAPQKLLPLTNGIELDLLDGRTRQGQGKSKDGFVVLYIGYVFRIRGIDAIVDAAAILKGPCPSVQWLLVGPTNSADGLWLEKELARRHLEHAVTHVGEIPHADALAHIRDADVCLFPFPKNHATNYIYPVKIFEYMAFAKPIVATNLQGIRRILKNGENALLIEPENALQLATAVKRLYSDKRLGRTLGRNAKDRVARYDWNEINSIIPDHLEALVRPKPH
jgi:glycosyltransferase involved in cell wall biosynthesis